MYPVRRGAKLYLSFVIARNIQFGDELYIVSLKKDRKKLSLSSAWLEDEFDDVHLFRKRAA